MDEADFAPDECECAEAREAVSGYNEESSLPPPDEEEEDEEDEDERPKLAPWW